jgi:hypothetical protein
MPRRLAERTVISAVDQRNSRSRMIAHQGDLLTRPFRGRRSSLHAAISSHAGGRSKPSLVSDAGPGLSNPSAPLRSAEAGWGAALLLFARPLLQALEGESVDRQVINGALVLGGRQLLQGLVTVRRPTRRILRIGAAVDALHAATMVEAAVANVGPRRLTMASATLAGAFSAAGVTQSRRR